MFAASSFASGSKSYENSDPFNEIRSRIFLEWPPLPNVPST